MDKIPLPSKFRLPRSNPYYDEIIKLHRKACKNEESTYTDPETGLKVFTAYYHLKRGSCCGSGCRHCPYGD